MRLKIIAGNVIAILVVGLISYFVVRADVAASFVESVDDQIARDQRLFERSFQVTGATLVEETESRANSHEVRAVFRAVSESSRRESAYAQAEATNRWFRGEGRGRGSASPDLVAITAQDGEIIARDKDIHRRPPLARDMPALRSVLADGRARHDVWLYSDENKLYEIAIAPIRNDEGQIVGALVVAYDLSLALQNESEILGRDLALVRRDAEGKASVYSSTLSQEDEIALNTELAGTHGSLVDDALQGRSGAAWAAALGGSEYVAMFGRLPISPSIEVAYVVLGNRSAAVGEAGITQVILLMTLLGALFSAVYGFFIGASFVKPIEQIEEGILAIINGRTDVRLDVESPELGGLAYRVNQLVNMFTGVSEADDQGRVAGAPNEWHGSAYGEGSRASAGPASRAASTSGAASDDAGGREPVDDPAIARALAAEPEEEYHARVYREYVEAKREVGEDVSNIPHDRFAKRLRANGEALAKKHECRMVRFQVIVGNGQVVLRPVIIR